MISLDEDVYQRPIELLHPIQLEAMKELVAERIQRDVDDLIDGKRVVYCNYSKASFDKVVNASIMENS
jgi:hypothetical protein